MITLLVAYMNYTEIVCMAFETFEEGEEFLRNFTGLTNVAEGVGFTESYDDETGKFVAVVEDNNKVVNFSDIFTVFSPSNGSPGALFLKKLEPEDFGKPMFPWWS